MKTTGQLPIAARANSQRFIALAAGSWLLALCMFAASAAADENNFRRPANDKELRAWLENMVVFHHFTPEEVSAATGLTTNEVTKAVARFHLDKARPPKPKRNAPLVILPYPGGRHPRIGFLDGAINPQRETKVSIFTPWDRASYVVADVPEAIFSNLGLTYLAHTHVPTIWTTQDVHLPPLEWQHEAGGALKMERTLPNGITFGTRVTPRKDGVVFDQWLRNGTTNTLTGMRVQNCVMLKAATGFNQQTNSNKILNAPYAAVGSEDGRRWIITAFEPNQRTWSNPPVPCMHSDPQYPDCAPGQTTFIRGWLSFYEGTDISGEFERLQKLRSTTR